MGNHFLIVTNEIDNETIHEESSHRSGLIEQLATRLDRKRDNQRLELTRNRLIIACVLALASDPLREEIWMPCEDHRQPVPGRVITGWTPNDRSLPLRFQPLRPIVNIAAAIYGNPPGNDGIGVIEQ